jgi:hypothetical protein
LELRVKKLKDIAPTYLGGIVKFYNPEYENKEA